MQSGRLAEVIFFILAITVLPSYSFAQNLFSPVIIVNDRSITYYELYQREALLKLLNYPGKLSEIAKQQLIEDRIKLSAAKDLGLLPTKEELSEGIEEFTNRTGLSTKNFLLEIQRLGVDENTFRDFVNSSIAWRNVIQNKFGARSRVSETQLDRTRNSNGNLTSLRVLLTEIILPAPPGQEQQAQEIAAKLSKITSQAEFFEAAKKYSAAPTRATEGRIKWKNFDELPDVLKPLIFGLAPGDVTQPLPLRNAIAIFQLRAIEETAFKKSKVVKIDYLKYTFPTSEKETLKKLLAHVNHCDDLYGFSSQYKSHELIRISKKPSDIKAEILKILNNLDAQENQILESADNYVFLMLCSRSNFATEADSNLENIRLGLRNQRLENYAQAYLANLLQDARIVAR